MTKSTSTMIVAAMGALAAAWLWFRSGEPATLATQGALSAVANTPSPAVDEVVAPPPGERSDTAPPKSAADSQNARQDGESAKAFADAFARGVTPAFVDYLTSKGLSRQDSEKTVAEAVHDMTTCVLDAMRVGAAAGNAPLPVSILGNIDISSERSGSCMTAVQQRVGLPQTVIYELRGQGSTFDVTARIPE